MVGTYSKTRVLSLAPRREAAGGQGEISMALARPIPRFPVMKRVSNFQVKVCKDLRDRLSGEMHAWRSHRMILAVGFQPTDRDASPSTFPVA